MVQRYEPVKVTTITKDGECKVLITLELNINVNNGTVSTQLISEQTKTEDKVEYPVPKFTSDVKVKFGKETDKK